jgi:hypothetical protein
MSADGAFRPRESSHAEGGQIRVNPALRISEAPAHFSD